MGVLAKIAFFCLLSLQGQREAMLKIQKIKNAWLRVNSQVYNDIDVSIDWWNEIKGAEKGKITLMDAS